VTLLANGLNPHGWTWGDRDDVCRILEATGRTIPRNKWVEEFALREGLDSFKGLM
jgi:hypothetical protein